MTREQAASKTTGAAPRKSLHIPKASEIVANNIRKKIVRGALNEGDFLPSESKLMEEFGVSRPTIREAFRILETEKLVSVSRGARGGAVVHEPDAGLISQYLLLVLQSEKTTIDEIYLARNFFEPSVVRQLAARSTAEDCALLRERLEEEIAAVSDPQAFSLALVAFHRTLVELSNNRPLIHLVHAINEVVERHQTMVVTERRNEQDRAGAIEVARKGLKSHKKLIDLIEARDSDAAATHWRTHMDAAFKTWVSGYEGMKILELFPD
jgi:GntR family transcriptional repressor for pyruvate dehydrogenase complex